MKRKERLSNTLVGKLEATGRDYRVWDTVTANLNVRVTPRGAKTFYLYYRNQDRAQHWLKLGKPPTMSVDEARQLARVYQLEVDKGLDPVADRQARLRDPDMKQLWNAYLEQHAIPKKKPRSVEEDRRLWRLHLEPRFGRVKVRSLTVAEVRSMHASMRSTPGAANRARALLSKMMSLAIKNEWRDTNPCQHVEKYPEQVKEESLSTEELHRLMKVLETDPDRSAAVIIQVLLFTGARKSEVLAMRWSDLVLESENPVWIHRAGEQKSERAVRKDIHRPIDAAVAELLLNWRTSSDVISWEWVFPSPRKHGAHRVDIKRSWNRIRRAARIEHVRLHDLRHTYASIAVSAGIPLAVVGRTMGHKNYRTTERYAHLTDESQRKAVSAVSANVLQAVGSDFSLV